MDWLRRAWREQAGVYIYVRAGEEREVCIWSYCPLAAALLSLIMMIHTDGLHAFLCQLNYISSGSNPICVVGS